MAPPMEEINNKNESVPSKTEQFIVEKEIGNAEGLKDLRERRIADLNLQVSNLEASGRGRMESINKSIGLSREKFNALKEECGINDKLKSISEKAGQYLQEAKTKLLEVAKTEEFNQIADATPFVGGVKRVTESVAGRTLSGEELSGKTRFHHGLKGALDLGLDIAAVGEVEKGAKLAYVGKTIATRLKNNPEALKNLGRNIIRGEENILSDSIEVQSELSTSEDIENNALKHPATEKNKTASPEVYETKDQPNIENVFLNNNLNTSANNMKSPDQSAIYPEDVTEKSMESKEEQSWKDKTWKEIVQGAENVGTIKTQEDYDRFKNDQKEAWLALKDLEEADLERLETEKKEAEHEIELLEDIVKRPQSEARFKHHQESNVQARQETLEDLKGWKKRLEAINVAINMNNLEEEKRQAQNEKEAEELANIRKKLSSF